MIEILQKSKLGALELAAMSLKATGTCERLQGGCCLLGEGWGHPQAHADAAATAAAATGEAESEAHTCLPTTHPLVLPPPRFACSLFRPVPHAVLRGR